MTSSSNKKGVVLLALIMAIIIASVVFIIVSLNADPANENLKDTEIVKVLIVLNDGNNNALATDVLLYYPASKKGALFNIPGNTGDIYESLNSGNGRGRTDRIDAVYHEQGIDAYNYEVRKLLGLDEIPFNMEISLSDFGLLTDLLGGMEIFLDSPVDVVQNPLDESMAEKEINQSVRWLLPSGYVTLDGDKIQTYIQYKLDDDDTDVETRRQTAVVSMLAALHSNRTVLLDKRNFPLYAGKFTTNTTDKILYKLFGHISNIDAETNQLSPQTLQGGLRRLSTGQILLFPYFEGQLIKDFVKTSMENLKNEGSSSYRYVLEVQNGTQTKGAATNATILLRGLGNYDVLPPSDADRSDYDHTVIVNHLQSESSDALNVLANFITCKNIEHDPSGGLSGGSNADFTIIIGKDWDGRYVRGGYVNPANVASQEMIEASSDN